MNPPSTFVLGSIQTKRGSSVRRLMIIRGSSQLVTRPEVCLAWHQHSQMKVSAEVIDLLTENHRVHDIFFNNDEFHNHFPHAVLTLFALGAPFERIKKEVQIENYLEPLRPKNPIDISELNWHLHIGDHSFYPNYLEFFTSEIAKSGALPTMIKYAFSETLLPSLLNGLYHPLIHLAFGVEFELDMIVAEALAEACGHDKKIRPIVQTKLMDGKQSGEHALPLEEIIARVRDDKSLDGLVHYNDHDSVIKVIAEASDKIKHYAAMFQFDHDDAKSLSNAMKELFNIAMLVYAATSFSPIDKHNNFDAKLDFFLMHLLTSAHSVQVLLPHLSNEHAALLLKGHFTVQLLFYITRGRPELDKVRLLSFSGPVRGTSWDHRVKLSFEKEEMHAQKVIRALRCAEKVWPDSTDLFDAASYVTLDALVVHQQDWTFDPIGFVQAWK